MLQQAQPGWADRPCGLALLHLQLLALLALLALGQEGKVSLALRAQADLKLRSWLKHLSFQVTLQVKSSQVRARFVQAPG